MSASAIEPTIARDQPGRSSDRGFGVVFTVVLAVVGVWPLVHGAAPRWWSLAMSALFLAIALVVPRLLGPLNRAWLAFGRLLHRVVSPLVMGLVFFLVVTPIGWLMRLAGKDVLSLARRADLPSYWVRRAGDESNSMTQQF